MHPGDLYLAVRKNSSIVSDTVKIKDGNGVSFFPPKEENEKCRGCLYNVIDQSYTDLHAWEMVSSVPFKAERWREGLKIGLPLLVIIVIETNTVCGAIDSEGSSWVFIYSHSFSTTTLDAVKQTALQAKGKDGPADLRSELLTVNGKSRQEALSNDQTAINNSIPPPVGAEIEWNKSTCRENSNPTASIKENESIFDLPLKPK
ncbi:hypothetical protein QQP08_015613 [Theobroma cacao]|nr:hypothetical protein QQP08_015613 [Theobroma cacao]